MGFYRSTELDFGIVVSWFYLLLCHYYVKLLYAFDESRGFCFLVRVGYPQISHIYLIISNNNNNDNNKNNRNMKIKWI